MPEPSSTGGVLLVVVDAEEQATLTAEHQIQASIKHSCCSFNEASPIGCDDEKLMRLLKELLTSRNEEQFSKSHRWRTVKTERKVVADGGRGLDNLSLHWLNVLHTVSAKCSFYTTKNSDEVRL